MLEDLTPNLFFALQSILVVLVLIIIGFFLLLFFSKLKSKEDILRVKPKEKFLFRGIAIFTAIFYSFILIFVLIRFQTNIIFKTADPLFWTLSTISQGLMALFALVGMLIIFKLQSLRSNMDTTIKGLFWLNNLKIDMTNYRTILMELDRHIKEYESKKEGDSGKYEVSKRKYHILENYFNQFEKIKQDVSLPMTLSLVTIFISIMLLPFCEMIYQKNIALSLLFLVLIFTFFSLVTIANYFHKTLIKD